MDENSTKNRKLLKDRLKGRNSDVSPSRQIQDIKNKTTRLNVPTIFQKSINDTKIVPKKPQRKSLDCSSFTARFKDERQREMKEEAKIEEGLDLLQNKLKDLRRKRLSADLPTVIFKFTTPRDAGSGRSEKKSTLMSGNVKIPEKTTRNDIYSSKIEDSRSETNEQTVTLIMDEKNIEKRLSGQCYESSNENIYENIEVFRGNNFYSKKISTGPIHKIPLPNKRNCHLN